MVYIWNLFLVIFFRVYIAGTSNHHILEISVNDLSKTEDGCQIKDKKKSL